MLGNLNVRRVVAKLFSSVPASHKRKSTVVKSRFRPMLEGLGDRVMPSAVVTEYSTPTSSSGPVDITPDPTTGGLAFAEFYAGKLGRISSTGTISEVSLSGVTSTPADVSVTADGTAWLTGWNSPVIARVGTNDVVTSISISGSGVQPNGSAVGPDGFVWFTTWGGGTIGKIDPSDNSVTQYSIGSGTLPCDIVAGPGGKMWFTEYGTGKVASINTDGTGLFEYTLDSGSNPIGLAPGTDGKVYVANSGTNQIAVVSPGVGVTTYSLTSGSVPWSVTQGPDGAVWFAESGTSKAGRIDTSGVITETTLPTSSSTPTGIAALPATSTAKGTIWVSELSGSQIATIDANAAPKIVDFAAVSLGNNVYSFRGKVIDENPGGLTITFGGGTSTMNGLTITTESDGTFLVTKTLLTNGNDTGSVTVSTVDIWGVASNTATVFVSPTP